jgi:hypothetical protein
LPLSDLLPDLLHPTRFVKLREVAQELQQVSGASVRPELLFY